jgi:hypothetical protein
MQHVSWVTKLNQELTRVVFDSIRRIPDEADAFGPVLTFVCPPVGGLLDLVTAAHVTQKVHEKALVKCMEDRHRTHRLSLRAERQLSAYKRAQEAYERSYTDLLHCFQAELNRRH